MLGSAREYKTRDRLAQSTLNIHQKYMNQYVNEGMTKEEASKKAYNMIISGSLSVEIKNEVKRIKNLQNKK